MGGGIPLAYFLFPNSSLLKIGKTRFYPKEFFKICTNGSSELLTNVSMSAVNMLYNVQLLKYIGENGVAAFGVIMYVNFVFISAFIGYSVGSASVTGYHYGAKNRKELKNILRKSLVIILGFSLTMLTLALLLSKTFSNIFVGYDNTLFELTKHGFRIFSFSFLFAGVAIFSSSFFTALNNGLISAIISICRTLIFQVVAVLLLPIIMGVDGIWYSVVVAEFIAVMFDVIFLLANKKKYGY